jgi:hypothetical protein
MAEASQRVAGGPVSSGSIETRQELTEPFGTLPHPERGGQRLGQKADCIN